VQLEHRRWLAVLCATGEHDEMRPPGREPLDDIRVERVLIISQELGEASRHRLSGSSMSMSPFTRGSV
jgi:hypothetical protein